MDDVSDSEGVDDVDESHHSEGHLNTVLSRNTSCGADVPCLRCTVRDLCHCHVLRGSPISTAVRYIVTVEEVMARYVWDCKTWFSLYLQRVPCVLPNLMVRDSKFCGHRAVDVKGAYGLLHARLRAPSSTSHWSREQELGPSVSFQRVLRGGAFSQKVPLLLCLTFVFHCQDQVQCRSGQCSTCH